MPHYHHRILETKLLEYIDFFSVVAITGPRQSGKTTLLKHLLPDYRYVTFDDLSMVHAFTEDPEKFIRLYDNRVIFDEVQRVPELFHYLKIAVDLDRDNPGKFVLTGSSQFSFIQKITESLAGRIGTLTLLPYQYAEMPKSFAKKSVSLGSYPELVNKEFRLSQDWYSSYLDTYINKDVRVLSNIGDMRDFLRLIHLLAAQTASILNLSRFATDIGVDVKTIKRWISILEASYIIFTLSPFYENFGKRIVKSPKFYFYDTGLVTYLTGLQNVENLENTPFYGALLENYVVAEILKSELHHKTHTELFYYRTSHGDEIDLIIDYKTKRDYIEIKASETYKPAMSKQIESLSRDQDRAFLLYKGRTQPSIFPLHIQNIFEYLASTHITKL